jgi:hypothetical protein
MTNREAIAADIEPYSLSENSVEKSFLDACNRFQLIASVDDAYTAEMVKPVAMASMLCLSRLRSLTAENMGGLSQSYDVLKIDKMISAIAQNAGLSPTLVLADQTENYVTSVNVW